MSFENLRSHLSKPSECCAGRLPKCKFHFRNVTRYEAPHCPRHSALAPVLAADIAVGGYIGEPAGVPTASAG
jgi:hypothetical protein